MDDNGTNHPGVQVDEMPDQAPEDGLNRHQRRAIKKMARLEREYEANPDASLAQARIMKKFTSLDRRLRRQLGMDQKKPNLPQKNTATEVSTCPDISE